MLYGRVKWYDSLKGYGYIIHCDGREIYFHCSAWTDRGQSPAAGASVTYDLIETRMGPEASNIHSARSSFYF